MPAEELPKGGRRPAQGLASMERQCQPRREPSARQSETNTLTTTIDAVRERPMGPIFQRHTRTNFGAAVLLAHANQESATPGGTETSITSHTLSSNLREDFLFSPRTSCSAWDRSTISRPKVCTSGRRLAAGLVKTSSKSSRTTFSVLGGLTYQHEKFFNGRQMNLLTDSSVKSSASNSPSASGWTTV